MKITTLLSVGLSIMATSFCLWSFTLTDPNLYFSTHPDFVQFQNTMWEAGQNRMLVTAWFVANILCSFALYIVGLNILKQLPKFPVSSFKFQIFRKGSFDFWRVHQTAQEMGKKRIFLLLLLASCVLLLFSNPALSHDIYNYIFNAKALIVYGQDPHVMSAIEIAPQDTWTRFMHNTHTPAPYGYVWTVMTIGPLLIGLGKFLTTFLAFKGFAALGLILLLWIQHKLIRVLPTQAASSTSLFGLVLFALNPLVLIEVLVNGHNDAWMMVLFLGSLVLLFRKKPMTITSVIASILLFVLSTQVKLATIVLLPVWIVIAMRQFPHVRSLPRWLDSAYTWVYRHWAEICVLLLFVPLLTSRSQQFHPWYLIWPLAFLPFVSWRWMNVALTAFSVTSLLRYVPFLLVGNYSATLLLQSKVITWMAVLSIPLYFLYDYLMAGRRNRP